MNTVFHYKAVAAAVAVLITLGTFAGANQIANQQAHTAQIAVAAERTKTVVSVDKGTTRILVSRTAQA
jgi:hypothetical protein